MKDFISQPWSWYVSGILIGLTVPTLLLLGNKHFGISSSLRHICAACIPGKVQFFQYNWKREVWNLFFVAGIVMGALLAFTFLRSEKSIVVAEATVYDLSALGVISDGYLMPISIFSFENIFTLKGLVFFVMGGFLVGFGTRYAGGCTSGHSIMGLSTLQWPSLVATGCFMAGGFIMVHLIFPWLLKSI
jgi:uncharacterized protein